MSFSLWPYRPTSIQKDTNAALKLIIDTGVMMECVYPFAKHYRQICLVSSAGVPPYFKFLNYLQDGKLKHKTNVIYAAKPLVCRSPAGLRSAICKKESFVRLDCCDSNAEAQLISQMYPNFNLYSKH